MSEICTSQNVQSESLFQFESDCITGCRLRRGHCILASSHTTQTIRPGFGIGQLQLGVFPVAAEQTG